MGEKKNIVAERGERLEDSKGKVRKGNKGNELWEGV